jgi:hypothetical protein
MIELVPEGKELVVLRSGKPLQRIERGSNPFFEMVRWPRAEAVVIGAGAHVHILDERDAHVLRRIDLEQDYFGGFGPDPNEALFVLGWFAVVCVDWGLEIRWASEQIAVDGIEWRGLSDDRILLSAEMNPPRWLDTGGTRCADGSATLPRMGRD